MAKSYDFGGYATRNNLRCADGRTIRQDAFKDCDGQTVPLVWQHMHDGPSNVLGHAVLENRSDGVYCYCSFNGSRAGQDAKEAVKHGDVRALSIYANKLQQRGHDVIHGVIREVSLVLSGANPGAYIDNLSFAHGDGDFETLDDEAVIKLVEDGNILLHADDEETESKSNKSVMDLFDEAVSGLDDKHKEAVYAVIGALVDDDEDEDEAKKKDDDLQHAEASAKSHDEDDDEADENVSNDDKKKPNKNDSDEDDDADEDDEDDEDDELEHADERTIAEIVEDMTEAELKTAKAVIDASTGRGKLTREEAEAFEAFEKAKKEAVYAIVGTINEAKENTDESDEAQHSDNDEGDTMKFNVFDMETGDETVLTHSDIEAIFDDAKRVGSLKDAVLAHGIQNIEVLFPEAQAVNNTPYPIARRMEWVSVVLDGVKKTPFARIKSTAANMTADEARAKGYIKGKKKIEEQISALKRVTTPQTVYKLQKLDRDDITDITDFDVVAWMKQEMRMMLDEEIARAILIGDGRLTSDESKIFPTNIRPVWTDEATYAINSVLITTGLTPEQRAREFVDAAIRSRKNYKGSGTPTMFIGPDLLVELRLLKDGDGYRRYKTDQELAEDLRVKRIVEVEVFDDQTRTVDGQTRELGAIILNMGDYTVGANKGGEVTLFDDFDLNYNKYEYLIETRMSGALTMPFSAIVIEFTNDGNPATSYSYTLVNPNEIDDIDEVSPAQQGWYEFNGSEYVATTDTEYDLDKTYYTRS